METAGLTSTVTGEALHGGRDSMLRAIHVRYRLPVGPDADLEAIDRVLGFHAQHCPIYRSLHPQIEITTELELVTETGC